MINMSKTLHNHFSYANKADKYITFKKDVRKDKMRFEIS